MTPNLPTWNAKRALRSKPHSGGPEGRKFTPETQKRICDAIKGGNYMETACAFAGVHKDTFYEWLKKGRAAKSGAFHDFVKNVEVALARSEIDNLRLISRAAREGAWQAAAWKLERMFPDRWGRIDRIKAEHTGPGGGPISVTVRVFDDRGELVEVIDNADRLSPTEPVSQAAGGNLQRLSLFPD